MKTLLVLTSIYTYTVTYPNGVYGGANQEMRSTSTTSSVLDADEQECYRVGRAYQERALIRELRYYHCERVNK